MKRNNLVLIGFALTIGFTASCVWLGVREHCRSIDGMIDCTNNFQRFLDAPPNEKGDALAGLAGSLAFLWIIITVLLQGKELAAQREELELTRVEFSKMAEAQGKQVDILSKQGEIFLEEQLQRKEVKLAELLEQELELLITLIRRFRAKFCIGASAGPIFGDVPGGYLTSMGNDRVGIFLLPVTKEVSVEEQYYLFDKYLEKSTDIIRRLCSDHLIVLESPNRDKFAEILSVARRLATMRNRLGEADKRRFERLKLGEVVKNLHELHNLPIWTSNTT